MTKRKPRYEVGDEIVVEDNDTTFIILDRQPFLQKIPIPTKSKRYTPFHGWEYWVEPVKEGKAKPTPKAAKSKLTKVNPKRKQLWVDETAIVAKVKYHPVVLTPARHVDLWDELPGYGDLRDFVESLPVTKRTRGPIRSLKELLENLALYHAGTSEEQANAGEEVGFILR